MRNLSLLVVLVFTATIGQVWSECNLTSVGKQEVIVYVLLSHEQKVEPLIELPELSNINNSCPQTNSVPCCVSDNGEEHLFLSVDDAFDWIESQNFPNATTSYLIGLFGNASKDTQLLKAHSLTELSSFTLQSFHNTSLLCRENATIELHSICSVTISNVAFSNCGTTSTAGLLMENIQFIDIESVTVTGSTTTGVDVTIFKNICSKETPTYSIRNSRLIFNGHRHSVKESETSMNGGGVVFNLYIPVIVTISDTLFMNNTASIGAGLAYTTYSLESTLTVLDCMFANNTALVHGGAAHVSGPTAKFINTIFESNKAMYTAGAVYQFIQFQTNAAHYVHVVYYNCSFVQNSAEGSGGLLIASSIIASPNITFNEVINITDCTFDSNKADSDLFFGETPCTVYSDNVFLRITNSDFTSNKATAVCVRSAAIIFSGNSNFSFNRGNLGGAVYTIRSKIMIDSNSSVLFNRNVANNGGAIYQNGQLTTSTPCLFELPEDGNYNITFQNNTAIVSGSAVYFYQPNQACVEELTLFDLSHVEYASTATKIVFHDPITTIDNDTYSVDLILGQKLVFNVTVTDYFNATTFAQVNVILENSRTDCIYLFGCTTSHELRGFPHVSLENGINQPNLYISGPMSSNNSDKYKLTIIGNVHVFGEVMVDLKPCPLGFVYNASKEQCVCVDNDVIACDDTLAKSCIYKGYWIGNTANNGISVAPCTSVFCKSNDNELCEPCPIPDQPEFCVLPRTSIEQCLSNRSGVVCSECIDDYALTFGGVQCVHDYLCDNGKGFIPAILNIVFVIFTIAILIVVLKFNDKLSSGYLFGFIYYFSIIRHLLDRVIIGTGASLFISIPASFTQLNPQFLGYIPICFSTELSALQQQVFLYLNPLIISSFVLLVIAVSLRFTKIKFGDNTMVKAICLLILLSFTALTETSFNIINPVQFPGSSRFVVNFQPSTKYLDLTEHLPYFIIAVIVFAFLVIPFTLLLLFAPLLTKCFNLNRIKPFLDEFQGCYKDRFRWMAGYYFAARLIYLLVLTSPRYLPVVTQYIIQLISFAVLVIHMLLQPYENTWLNFADSVLLADLVLITLLFGTTAEVVFRGVPFVRIGIVIVLVIIPILYLIALVIVMIGNKFKFKRIQNLFTKKNGEKESLWMSFSKNRSPSTNTDLREPLLDIYDDGRSHTESMSTVSTFRHRSRLVSHSVVWRAKGNDDSNGNDQVTISPALQIINEGCINGERVHVDEEKGNSSQSLPSSGTASCQSSE